jgi:integrase/recombinase XerD
LRGVRAIPLEADPGPATAVEALLADYRRYLVLERRLAPSSVTARVAVARRFLAAHDRGGELALERLTPSDVTEFVLAESRRYRPASMKPLTVALRCLLRFVFLAGLVGRDLSGAVPAIAHRASGLPKGIEASTVVTLLNGCDQSRPIGLRDRAILTLLVRLGLRAGEVAALRLDEVDWRAGELVVRGKGNRIDRLPLPADVGTVLVDYLRRGRPRSACRVLFLRACAPYDAMTARSVTMVPRTASTRAGLPVIGAHRLRHTAATGMLRAGASLPEIAQALRHRSQASTAIYAAVDRAALDAVVRPWPGADR